MTLILAFKWLAVDGVVVALDSKATGPGFITYEVRKVYPVVLIIGDREVPLAIAAGF